MSVTVHHGDCLDVLRGMDAASVDACVTDPPYHLTSIVKRFGAENAAPAKSDGATGVYGRASAGFMGKRWDGGDVAFKPETWAEVLRVMKPGAHLVAFGSTRGYHRMACAIEDAGFEIRDQLAWLYGSGFPKSHDIGKAIDKAAGAEREVVGEVVYAGGHIQRSNGTDLGRMNDDGWHGGAGRVATAPATPEAARWSGWGTALKPAHEPIVLARKPLARPTVAAQVLATGTGALNVDGCRVASGDANFDRPASHGGEHEGWDRPWKHTSEGRQRRQVSKDQAAEKAANMGRWPANLVHDGSPEVMAAFATFATHGAGAARQKDVTSAYDASSYHAPVTRQMNRFGDEGSPARFFPALGFGEDEPGLRFWYSSKAGRSDRIIRDVEEVTVEWISEQGPCLVRLQADTGQSPEKAIVASGSGDVPAWSTFLCGSTITDLCRRGSGCTIETTTSSITASTTWSCLIRSLISASTADVSFVTASGGSRAENAARGILSATITLAQTVSLPGASRAASGTQLRISVSAKRHSHPTCKPLALMRWLCRLVTPPGGVVLDCFAGTGVTGEAAMLEGFGAVLIEREAEHVADIRRRLGRAAGADAPLFAESAA